MKNKKKILLKIKTLSLKINRWSPININKKKKKFINNK
jgi:hypothetical protein